jgi:Zn-finger nucleic acid-binding protein
LFDAARAVLSEWRERLIEENGDGFPTRVTAFRMGMAVHGRFRHPCPSCGTRVQRLRYATNEANYCPRCQTDGRLLADRSLSRLLRKDWPRTLDELERRYDTYATVPVTPASRREAEPPPPDSHCLPEREPSGTQTPRPGRMRHGQQSTDIESPPPHLGQRGRKRRLIKRDSS